MRFFTFAELSLVLSLSATLSEAAAVHLQRPLTTVKGLRQHQIQVPVKEHNSIRPAQGKTALPHFCATFPTGMLQKWVVYLSDPSDYDMPYLDGLKDRLIHHMKDRSSGVRNDCNPRDIQTATHPDHPGVAVAFYTEPTCHVTDVSRAVKFTSGYWKDCSTDVTRAFAEAGEWKSEIADLTGRFFTIA